MPDPRFHHRSGPLTLGKIAEITGATLHGGADASRVIEDVAPLDKAESTSLSFLDNIRYKEQFAATKAGACIIAPEMQKHAPAGASLLLTPQPYKAYAIAAQAFYPEANPVANIHQSAIVSQDAVIGKGVTVEAGAVIGAGAEIGEGCWIEANAVIGPGVVVGAHCRIGANATVSHCIMGDHVRVYPGCRIGQDGFGFAIDPAGFIKVPQLGRVLIGDGVEIGANATIDRGSGPDTEIGAGTWIDNLVQIGHNVKIGRGCVLVSQVGISGSSVIEDYVMIGGQVGIAGHLRIGKGAKIGAQSGVMRDVPAGEEQLGSPAVPLRQAMRQVTALARLVKKDNKD